MRKKRYPISQDFRIQNYLFSRVLETHYCRVFPFLYKSHRVRNFATFQKAPPRRKLNKNVGQNFIVLFLGMFWYSEFKKTKTYSKSQWKIVSDSMP